MWYNEKRRGRVKKLYWKILWIGIAVLWMAVIFYFSSQDGSHSASMSGRLTSFVIRLFVKDYSSLSLEQQKEIYSFTSYILRKVAHFTEYSILALFLFLATFTFTNKGLYLFGIPITLSILYAVSDEFHQSFVADRIPQFKDIVVDSFGAVAMLFIIGIILNIVGIVKSSRKYD